MATAALRLLALAAVTALLGCGGATSVGPTGEPAVSSQPSRAIAPGEIAPPFHVVATDGTVLDSRDLVGRRPFVVLFFASWCRVCEVKLPGFQRALARAGGDVTVITVSLDDDDTWGDVPGFAARFGLSYPLVRGAGTDLAAAYDPRSAVPFTLVVDPHGEVLEAQSGWSRSDEGRLVAALDLARRRQSGSAPRE